MKKRGVVLVALLAADALAWVAFRSFGGGLVTPNGSIHAGLAVLGAFLLVARVAALFVVPPLAVYWATLTLGRRVAERDRDRP